MRLDAAMQWSALVPVKAKAKSRLDPNPDARARLSRAFLSDVLHALTAAVEVDEVIVVTDDPELPIEADTRVRVHMTSARGLNEELNEALRTLTAHPVAIFTADLPCLNVAAVSLVLRQASGPDRSFVTDAQGLGTTALLAHDARHCEPMFGIRSHARHAQAGCTELKARSSGDEDLLRRVRRDVDTALDLWDAQRIGVGPATLSALTHN